jgi:hypothetical protein
LTQPQRPSAPKPAFHISLNDGSGLAVDEIDFGVAVVIARRKNGEKFFIPYASIRFVKENPL